MCYYMKSRKVYILGAGCSVNYGYPLAKGFLDALKKYQAALERRTNCERLKQCLANTVALLEKHRAPTIDRLVRWIEDEVARQKQPLTFGQGAESSRLDQIAWDKIRDAKIVTVSLFLERESAAWQTELQSYDEFLHILFNGNRNQDALHSTSDDAIATLDGQKRIQLQSEDRILIRKSESIFDLVRPVNRNYYEVLRSKLKWGAQ